MRWVQDEPANMGPWPHYALNVWPDLDVDVEPITREESSSPSVGTMKRHTAEQKDLLDRAFELIRDSMYFTDRGIEELERRRGEEEVTLAWVADRLQEFTDTHPEFETAVERFATWLARLDDPED